MIVDSATDQFEWELENWGRWGRVKRGIGECNSLEHNWRSPQTWEPLPPPPVPVTLADKLAALVIEQAWQDVPLPYNRVLLDWYCFKRRPSQTCRKWAIRFVLHDEYMLRAKSMLRNILTANARRTTSAPRLLTPAS